MRRSTTALASTIVAAAVVATPVVANASPAHAPYRGQARIDVLYFGDLTATPAVCQQGKPGKTPALVEAQIDVRWAKGKTWHQRGNATVLIQKRSPSGAWITVARAVTDWNDSAVPGWGHADRQFHSNVNVPSRRWFRAYIAATPTFKAVTTEPFQAHVFCGED
jgi:hypothetical protein